MITLRATVRNVGNKSSTNTTLRWYLSTDNIIDTNDTLVETNALSSLAAGDGSSHSITITVTNIPSTNYYFVCVDSETNEYYIANNCSSAVRIVVASPELIVTNMMASTNTVALSEIITLTAMVSNVGTRSSATTTLRWYLSTNSTIDINEDIEIEASAVNILEADDSSNVSISIAVTNAPSTYYYYACVDSVTGETNSNDNCSSAVRVVVTAPDLIVTNMMASRTNVIPSEMITLTATVRNMGTRSSATTTLRWYLSTDNTIDTNDTQVATNLPTPLASGTSNTVSISTNVPGTYYYGACVDGETREYYINNNCSSAVKIDVIIPGIHLPTRDFTTLSNANNRNPRGIWSDHTNMWVAD